MGELLIAAHFINSLFDCVVVLSYQWHTIGKKVVTQAEHE
jgi:hypothetical protein